VSLEYLLDPTELDIGINYPGGLLRAVDQGLVNLTPWHIMQRDLAKKRFQGVRQRYRVMYVPFARRQDNDDLACFDPARPQRIFIIHDFAPEGAQEYREFPSFWDWFRSAVEDMMEFD